MTFAILILSEIFFYILFVCVSLHACAYMFIIMNTQCHMNKKEILIGHNMDKAIRVTLLSDALP